MSDAIIVALISAGVTLIGVIINSRTNYQRLMAELDKRMSVYQARTDERIDELTRETREHNNFARRLPVLESQLSDLTRRVSQIEQRPSA